MRLSLSLITCLAFCATAVRSRAVEPAPRELAYRQTIRPFLQKHCFECHDDSVQKGNIRLDDLAASFDKPAAQALWLEIFDKIASGEMPPKKKARPEPADSARVLAWLTGELTTADLARHNTTGRVVLRRLNRVQYENSIQDLLGVNVPIKDLLPEDGTSMGFDNVAAALNVSSVLMERYLEAADAALDMAIQTGPELKPRGWQQAMGPGVSNPNDYRLKQGVKYLPDETFVYFNSGETTNMLDRWKAPAEGWYTFRVRAYAYQSPGLNQTFCLMAGSFDPRLPRRRTVGFYEVEPDKARLIQWTEYLPVNGTIKVQTHGLGRRNMDKQEVIDAYKGPGIAIMPVQVIGPINECWPPPGHQRLFGSLDLKKATAADAEKPLLALAGRAFRRPVTAADVKPFLDLVSAQLSAGQPFESAIRAGFKAILCSPDFLFLREPPGKLDDYAIASRLSYFLWSSTPDDALLKLAASKSLSKPEVLRAQVERLLNDSRAQAFTSDFTGQWLSLRQLDATSPDKKLYPEFDDYLQWSMPEETTRFFDKLLTEDRSILNFVHSDFSILNARLAKQYGIPGVAGAEFRSVALPAHAHRGGIMGQAAILKVTANGTVTSPVVRGAWIMRNLVGQPPKPPPANVPAVEPDIRGAKTIREQLDKHRNLPACASCHAQIDPPGLALESFDVIGGYRENYRSVGQGKPAADVDGKRVGYKSGPPVDCTGVLADGRSFKNIEEFKGLLLSNKDQVARCLTEKLLVYATGAGLDFADRPAVEKIIARARENGYGLRTMVHEVVESSIFLSK